MTVRKMSRVAAVAALTSLIAPAVLAHHPMGGVTPSTLTEGILSGLGHPVIGLDHFAFLVALGLLVVGQQYWLRPAAAFVAGSVLGVIVCAVLGAPQWTEVLVALSVVIAGRVLMTQSGRPDLFTSFSVLGALSFAGVFHGLAFGEAIIGSDRAVLGSYLTGLAAVQIMIILGVAAVCRALSDTATAGRLQMRIAGGAVAALGAIHVGLALLSA